MSSTSKFYGSLAVFGVALSVLDVRIALAYGVTGLLSLVFVQVSAMLSAGSYTSFMASTFSEKIEGSKRFYAVSGLAMIVGAFIGIFIRFAWLQNAL
jgi:hypothetical protein